MTKSSITYIDALNAALTAELSEEVKDKLTALREQIAKRNSAERKPTKAQKQNAELSEVVRAVLLNASEPLTVSEIMGRDDTLSMLSNQKVSAVIRSMGAEVVKSTDKRVSKFALAA
jgi:hypothetical protein